MTIFLSNDRGSYPESTWRRFFPTKVTINNGTITGNHAVLTGHKVNNDPYAENGVGGGIYVASQEVTINGANITNNTAGKQGGGVYVAAVPYRLQMGKTMVTGNTATKLGWAECGFAQQEVQRRQLLMVLRSLTTQQVLVQITMIQLQLEMMLHPSQRMTQLHRL